MVRNISDIDDWKKTKIQSTISIECGLPSQHCKVQKKSNHHWMGLIHLWLLNYDLRTRLEASVTVYWGKLPLYEHWFECQLLLFQSSPLLMAWEKEQRMAQAFRPLLPTWVTQMNLLCPGFRLDQPWPSSHLKSEPLARRALCLSLSLAPHLPLQI